MQQPQSGNPPGQHSHQGTLFLWPDHWQIVGRLMPNRPHRHISASLLVGIDGDFRLQVDGQWRQTRAALVAPDVVQALDPGSIQLWCAQLDPDGLPWRALRRLLGAEASVDLAIPGDVLPTPGERRCDVMAGCLERLLDRVGTVPQALDRRVAWVCRELRQQQPERLDVRSLAAAVNLSASRLTHLFRQETGVPLRRFLLHLKMNRALAFWEPGKSVSQLAVEAGFYDQPHLVRTTRDMFDALPSEYVTAGWFRVCRCNGSAGSQ